jgi:chromate transporter
MTGHDVPPLGEALRVWARIGLLSFGGPAGQIALMHSELVEKRRWIGEQRFLHALNYCMLLPGPEAQQLATYIGWLMHRTAGGLMAGLLFIIPGALVMLGLSILFALWHEIPVVDAAFLGVKAAVLAVVVEAVIRIGRRALRNRALVLLAVASFVAIHLLHLPFPLIILAAGLTGWLGNRFAPGLFTGGGHAAAAGAPQTGVIDAMFERGELAHATPSWPRLWRTATLWLALWLAPVALLLMLGGDSVWPRIAGFFSVMAVVTFGGAYAVLSYVAQAAVETYGWLSAAEMVSGLGLAETTPGPLILVLQFVGFLAAFRAPGALDPLVAGSLGALLVLWVTFAPCFLWIFAGAPWVEALRNNRAAAAGLTAITAAVVGVVMNLAVWFALHVVFRTVDSPRWHGIGPDVPVWASLDVTALSLALVAAIAILRLKIGLLRVLALCAALGVASHLVG